MMNIGRIKSWACLLALTTAMFLAGCASSGSTGGTNTAVSNSDQSADYRIDDLDNYGTWIALPPYGTVWKPNVTADWEPFYYGHWDYTAPNWTWVSYEPFGWVVYHYGNWYYGPGYGWVWIPGGGAWSPARVEWATYDDFVCWAPLPPRGVALPSPWERYENVDMWNVVRAKDFAADNVGSYRVDRLSVRPQEQPPRIVHRLPDPKSIERYSGRPIPTVNIPREPVKVGKQQLHRMRMPPTDQQRADQHKGEVEKHVTKSTGEQRTAGNRR